MVIYHTVICVIFVHKYFVLENFAQQYFRSLAIALHIYIAIQSFYSAKIFSSTLARRKYFDEKTRITVVWGIIVYMCSFKFER